MPCYLGEYEGSATDKVRKFHRAVNSFINQTYENKELIVIADGCDKTIAEVGRYWEQQVKWTKIHKAELFSGIPRDIGLKFATGDVICYLDADDYLLPSHLQSIADEFEKFDTSWITFNDLIVDKLQPQTGEIMISQVRKPTLNFGEIGTCNIAHKNLLGITWQSFDGYGHDWKFIEQLIIRFPNQKHADFTSYYVCHIPNQCDN